MDWSRQRPVNFNHVVIDFALMRCPVCQRDFEKAESKALPFCSERCRTIDLGRWLGESYRLPVEPDAHDDESQGPDLSDGNGSPGTSFDEGDR